MDRPASRVFVTAPLVLLVGLGLATFLRGQPPAVGSTHGPPPSTSPPASPHPTEPSAVLHGGLVDSVAARIHVLETRISGAAGSPDSVLALARLLHDGHQEAKAVRYYRRYLETRPDHRQTWLDLANALATLERWPEALQATQDLLALRPDDLAAAYNMGAISASLGDVEQATHWWSRVAAGTDPDLGALANRSIRRLASSGHAP